MTRLQNRERSIGKQQNAVEMYQGGMKVREIAEAMHMDAWTVKRYLMMAGVATKRKNVIHRPWTTDFKRRWHAIEPGQVLDRLVMLLETDSAVATERRSW